MLEALRIASQTRPTAPQVLAGLGRLEEGLAVDERLVRLTPENPAAHYNMACSLALLGRGDAALDSLERAVERGYDDAPFMLADDDLTSLRGQARFRALVARLEARAGSHGDRV